MSDFCSKIWPEEPTPINLKDCRDCGLYEHGTRMVWGEGNSSASIMIILDNPGAREDREGSPYVCGTRQTLQQTTHEVGLDMEDLYMTFILKRRPTHAYNKARTRLICIQHLEQQIEMKKPALIICLGNVAVQSFFQDPDADVKSLRGKWHNIRGYETAVAYHPLAIRRRPNLQALFMEDWQFIAERYAHLNA